MEKMNQFIRSYGVNAIRTAIPKYTRLHICIQNCMQTT